MSEELSELQIGDFCDVSAGGTPDTTVKEYWEHGTIPWMSSGEVHKQRIRETESFITPLGLRNSSAKIFPKDSVLVALAGQGKTRGKVAISKIELTTNQSIAAIIAKKEICDPEFLYYNLSNRYEELRSLSGGSGRAGLNLSILSGIEISLPPLPEQNKIAEILSEIDEQIANKTRKVEKHQHLLAGILNQLMTSGTTDQKVVETDAGRVPENWRVGRVEDFFDLGRGRVISIPHIKENPGPYPVFSSQSKNNGEMGRMNSYDFEGDYFTWTTDGAYAGSVFARSGKFNCTNVCGTGRAKSSSEADTRFAAYFLQRVAKRHVSYVGNPKLMNNVFAAIPFALPPIDEQREIIKAIDSTKIGIELLERQITSLSNLQSSIASDLLSGRKRVSV
jgi:type I restriction enzyme S subunit